MQNIKSSVTSDFSQHQRLIQYINSIRPVPPTEVRRIASLFHHRKMKKNEPFLRAGDRLESVAFNLNGSFRYFYIDYQGNDKTKYFVSENDFILSLSALIENSGALFSIEAMEDSDVLVAPAEQVSTLLKCDPYWQTVYRFLLEKTYVIKEKREAEFLLYDAKERYLRFIETFPGLGDKVKQRHIASYLGIAPESLSRIRSDLKRV